MHKSKDGLVLRWSASVYGFVYAPVCWAAFWVSDMAIKVAGRTSPKYCDSGCTVSDAGSRLRCTDMCGVSPEEKSSPGECATGC